MGTRCCIARFKTSDYGDGNCAGRDFEVDWRGDREGKGRECRLSVDIHRMWNGCLLVEDTVAQEARFEDLMIQMSDNISCCARCHIYKVLRL